MPPIVIALTVPSFRMLPCLDPAQPQGRPARSGPSFVRGIGAALGTQMVKIIRNEGGEDEEVVEVEAHVQAENAFFDVDTPLFEGDIVEVADPRRPEGVERRVVAQGKVNNFGPTEMQHITVTWGRLRHRASLPCAG